MTHEGKPVVALVTTSTTHKHIHPAWAFLFSLFPARAVTINGTRQLERIPKSDAFGYICILCGTQFALSTKTATRHVSRCKLCTAEEALQKAIKEYENSLLVDKQSKLLQEKLVVTPSSVIKRAYPEVKLAQRWPRTSALSLAVDQSVLQLVAMQYLPFSIVDSDAFRTVLDAASQGFYQPFSARQCSEMLPNVALELQKQVRCPWLFSPDSHVAFLLSRVVPPYRSSVIFSLPCSSHCRLMASQSPPRPLSTSASLPIGLRPPGSRSSLARLCLPFGLCLPPTSTATQARELRGLCWPRRRRPALNPSWQRWSQTARATCVR